MRAAIAQILRQSNNDVAVGGAVLCTNGLLFTCAHVVAFAHGQTRIPNDPPGDFVTVRLPFATGRPEFEGRIVGWIPRDEQRSGDIAIIHCSALGSAHAWWAPLGLHSYGSPMAAIGFTRDGSQGADGQWISGVAQEARPDGWVQVEDVKQTGYWVKPGFSGSPVWDPRTGAAVGIVAAVDADSSRRVGYMIPSTLLVSEAARVASGVTGIGALADAFLSDRLAILTNLKKNEQIGLSGLTIPPGALRALADHLDRGEICLSMASAAHAIIPGTGKIFGLLTVTDRRLIYMYKAPMLPTIIKDYYYTQIRRIRFKERSLLTKLFIYNREVLRIEAGPHKKTWLTKIHPKERGPEIATYVQRRLDEGGSHSLFMGFQSSTS